MDDTISRQAAIDAFYKYPNVKWTTLDVLEHINALPSAERHGRWVDVEHAPNGLLYATCSVCGKRQTIETMNYCGNCGARMEVE